VAEGEARCHLLTLIGPTLAHEDAFIRLEVEDVPAPIAGIFAQAVGRTVRELHGEGERKPAAGRDTTHEDGGKRNAGVGTQIPVLHDDRHLVDPRHGKGVAGELEYNQILVRLGQCGDNGIVTVGQAQTATVGVLAVLADALVQAVDEDDIMGIPGLFHGFSDELFGEYDHPSDSVRSPDRSIHSCIARIATRIDHLGQPAIRA